MLLLFCVDLVSGRVPNFGFSTKKDKPDTGYLHTIVSCNEYLLK